MRKVEEFNCVCEINFFVLLSEGDSEEPLEESREEQSTELEVSIPPSVPVLKSDSGLSMIEYDPVGSTQELASYAETTTTTMNSTSGTADQIVPPPPVSYEKFKASLVEDPSVTTSTTTASPSAVVVVATCSSPAAVPAPRVIMTRSMKRAAVPLKAGDVPAIKAAKKVGVARLFRAARAELTPLPFLFPFADQIMKKLSLSLFLLLSNSCLFIALFCK